MESWSRVDIFNSGDDYFKSLRQDIREAQKSITIESYIFTFDKLTEGILDDLRQARERGVSIKIIIDGFGSYYSIPQINKYCTLHNIELRIFHPLPYPSMWLRRLPHWPEKTWFRRMNRRNHRKISIIDEKIAYL
ncbi:MAG: phospholipase D-like domain-containing protein [Bacillota bacterium]